MDGVHWMGTAGGWVDGHKAKLTPDLTTWFAGTDMMKRDAVAAPAPAATGDGTTGAGAAAPAAAVTPTDEPKREPCCFEEADPFTVRVRGFGHYTSPSRFEHRQNDVVIVTRHSFSPEPWVTRVHYQSADLERGWHGDFFEDTVVAKRDFRPDSDRRLDVQILIYDTDTWDLPWFNSAADVVGNIAVINPVLKPFAGLATDGLKSLLVEAEKMDGHDRIIDQRLVLELGDSQRGRSLLQPGYFVCFENEVDPSGNWWLDSQLRVCCADGDADARFTACSYVVIEIAKDFSGGREFLIDQKVTKLVSELAGKGQSGEAPLHFLRQTLRLYDNFKRLERARSIMEKKSPSPAEKTLLDELKQDPELKQYLDAKDRNG